MNPMWSTGFTGPPQCHCALDYTRGCVMGSVCNLLTTAAGPSAGTIHISADKVRIVRSAYLRIFNP